MNPTSETRRLLVIGGSGELGWQVVTAAGEWAVDATYCSRPPATAPGRWHQLDVRDAPAVKDLVARVRPRAIIHAAVSDRSRGSGESESALADKIIRGGINVVQAGQAVGARCIVMSTDLVFDGRKGSYREEDIPNPIMSYGQAKVDMEKALLSLQANVVVVRTSLILNLDPIGRHFGWILEGVRRGEPRNLFVDELRCPIWGDELATALLELAGLDTTGLLHLAGPEVTNRYEIGQHLARVFDLDTNQIRPASSAASGLKRPLDCTLDSGRAYALLKTPIHGVSDRFGA